MGRRASKKTETPPPEPAREPSPPRRRDPRYVGCAAVVVNFRSTEDTVTCVRALRATAPDLVVVVVDNGSADGSAEALQRTFDGDDDVEFVPADENRGFGAGCNLGFEHLLTTLGEDLRYVLLVNPDCEVDVGCVETLLQVAMRHPEVAIAGGRILDASDHDQIVFENGRITTWLTRLHRPAPPGKHAFPTDFVTGALMLVDAALLRDGVRFDERYFMYVEDVDLCAQARRRGRLLWIDTEARAYHRGGGSRPDAQPLIATSDAQHLEWLAHGKALYARKHFGLVRRTMFWLGALVLKPMAALVLTRSSAALGPHYRGLWSGRAVAKATRATRSTNGTTSMSRPTA